MVRSNLMHIALLGLCRQLQARGSSFMERQEAKERARRKDLERSRKEREYLATLDKKRCPVSANHPHHRAGSVTQHIRRLDAS
jgi:hypothetical protein